MSHHEPPRKGERWVGNTNRAAERMAELKAAGITSARLGKQAFDIDGKPISPLQYKPVFISNLQAAKYNDYMMTKSFGPNWRRS